MEAEHVVPAIKRILRMQAGVVVFVSALILALFGWLEARSAFLGGLAGFLPNAYFGYRVARSKGEGAQKIVRTFYAGESVKIIITAVLFFLILQLPDILFMPLFAGFVSVIMVFWFALLMRST